MEKELEALRAELIELTKAFEQEVMDIIATSAVEQAIAIAKIRNKKPEQKEAGE